VRARSFVSLFHNGKIPFIPTFAKIYSRYFPTSSRKPSPNTTEKTPLSRCLLSVFSSSPFVFRVRSAFRDNHFLKWDTQSVRLLLKQNMPHPMNANSVIIFRNCRQQFKYLVTARFQNFVKSKSAVLATAPCNNHFFSHKLSTS
jgi:hypothetical protein